MPLDMLGGAIAAAIDSIALAVGTGSAVLQLLNGLRHLDLLDGRFGAAPAARAKFDSAASDDTLQEMWEKRVMPATLAGMTCLMRAPVGAIVAMRDGQALPGPRRSRRT